MRYQRLLLVILLLLIPTFTAAQLEATPIIIENIDTNQYPNITIDFRYLDRRSLGRSTFNAEDAQITIDKNAITPVERIETIKSPLAVSIIVDTSAAMNDQSTPASNRFNDMFEQIQTLISMLRRDTEINIISFNPAISIQTIPPNDDIALLNALDLLSRNGMSSEDPQVAYGLDEAVRTGIRQLQDHQGPTAIIVYAAGVSGYNPNSNLIDQFAESAENPPFGMVVGFGADQDGQFTTYPSNPAALQALAEIAQWQFIAYSLPNWDTNAMELLNTQMQDHYNQLLNSQTSYRIHISAPPLTAGDHLLQLVVGSAVATKPFSITNVPPQIKVVPESLTWDSETTLTVDVAYTQNDIQSIEYLMNNIVIGSSTTAPNFPLTIDPYDSSYGLIPHSMITLQAAATDTQGLASRSEPVTITLLPAKSSLPWIGAGILGIIILGGMGGGYYFFNQNRKNRVRKTNVNRPFNPDEAITNPADGSINDKNGGYNFSHETKPNDITLGFTQQWELEILEPASLKRRFPLNNEIIHIGRHRLDDFTIIIDDVTISRDHAYLRLNRQSITIYANQSLNGTYIEDAQGRAQPLEANQPYPLQHGSIFWLGTEVKMRLTKVNH
ncbi:FHA domain-containing protein [Herpetosiphon gulosus]|uniref:FHA domain-containing protein n=1 Tax=Herpetosiphon gulosus TaxID=1973496 RepID=A0ABP9X794_9CHLR